MKWRTDQLNVTMSLVYELWNCWVIPKSPPMYISSGVGGVDSACKNESNNNKWKSVQHVAQKYVFSGFLYKMKQNYLNKLFCK